MYTPCMQPKVAISRAQSLIRHSQSRQAVHAALVDPVQQARVDALMQKFMDADHDGMRCRVGFGTMSICSDLTGPSTLGDSHVLWLSSTNNSTGNGVIDKQELRSLLESVGGDAPKEHWLTDTELDAIYQLYDKDSNGTISFDEFVHLAEDGVLLEGKLHEYEAIFQAMDTDGDNTLSATEIHAMMKQLGIANVDMVCGLLC